MAEGVESEDALRELAELGCDAIQGFHLARPLPADELGEWLRSRSRGLEAAGPRHSAAIA